jgi:tripartite-type tricarboxylate transporter receptor subunit TctC
LRPPAVIDKASAEVQKVLNAPDLKDKAEAVDIYVVSSGPDEFAAFIKHEAARWPAVVKKGGLHFD